MGHKIIVARISAVEAIAGADRIQKATCLGETVVVSKEHNVGDIGLFFPVDLQLSEQFCHENNLFRNVELNKDKEKTGFFDENRRVRAQPFLKVKSSGLFMTFDAIAFTGADASSFGEGTAFDEVNGIKLCEKYVSKASKEKGASNKTKAAKKDYAPFFAKHVDSEQFKHYADRIPAGSLLHFHAKVHGTSARMGYLPVMQELPKWKATLNKWIGYITKRKTFHEEYVYDYIVGTRNVVLKTGDEAKHGFHGPEQFRFDVFEMVKPFLEKGQTVYGEIAGYANGSRIMPEHNVEALKNKDFVKKYGKTVTYSYGCKEHELRFHIYRITMTTEHGTHIDFTQKQIDEWCSARGLLGPVEVHSPMIYDGDVEKLRALVEEMTERPFVLTEDYIDPSHISEGIILRVDGGALTPDFYKSKSWAFRACEGLCEVEDPEDSA